MILSSKWRRKVRGGAALLFFLYLFALAYGLFFAEMYGRTAPRTGVWRYNFVPFTEIRRFIRYRKLVGNRAFFINIIGNVLGFMPYGFFLPLVIDERRKGGVVCVSGCLMSFCVECIQLVTQVGSFDVDDILLNSLGTILGYCILESGLAALRQMVSLRQAAGGIFQRPDEFVLNDFVFTEEEEETWFSGQENAAAVPETGQGIRRRQKRHRHRREKQKCNAA